MNEKLSELREKIDNVDNEILKNLSERMKISKEIGELKKKQDIPILQSSRWQHVLFDRIEKGKKMNLNDSFLCKLYQLIHEESMRQQ